VVVLIFIFWCWFVCKCLYKFVYKVLTSPPAPLRRGEGSKKCQQRWSEHFTWNYDSTKVEGLTTIGRATIVCLRMNNPVIIVARRRWTMSGWHPPDDVL
jgi:hypothetical protein